MQLSDFRFDIPDDLIAQQPLPERCASRLLVLNDDQIGHHTVHDLPALLQPGDHLVFNDTRVIPARLFGQKHSGGRLELLVERVLDEARLLTKIRASHSPKPGSWLGVAGVDAQVLGRKDDLFELRFDLEDGIDLNKLIEKFGVLPLPPYIHRPANRTDAERYQTVYATQPGAVAAPTAGLHFDDGLFVSLAERGISHSFITLHVGAGTFMPVRVQSVSEHVMHPERVSVSAEAVEEITAARARGGRIIAVGTTSVRAMEAASAGGTLQVFNGDTRLFITPGYAFRAVDGIVTNFHLSESTLLMLVCAFAGHQHTLAAYAEAVRMSYRFFSYGDAMLVWPASVRPT